MNLFALTDSGILKFKLNKQLQLEIKNHFLRLEKDFFSSIERHIPFDGRYKPDTKELLSIENFTEHSEMNAAIHNPRTTQDFYPSFETFYKTKAVFTGYVDNSGITRILVQKFDKRKIISTKGLSLFFDSNTFKKLEGDGLTLDNRLTGVVKENTLYFPSFYFIKQIFDMSEHYVEATNQDIDQFAKLKSVSFENLEELKANADSWIRRKLALIYHSKILETVSLNDIKKVAKEFNIRIETNSNKQILFVSNKKLLKPLLKFLDEEYYLSPLTHGRYETNSRKAL